jgi:small subunit ribosomal protein S7
MRGRAKYKKNPILPDAKFKSLLLAKLINKVLLRGQKDTARNIVYKTVDILAEKTKEDGLHVIEQAIANVSPLLEVRSKRIGGATYQVPTEVRADRKITLATRWIINAARARQGKPMQEFLADEMLNAYNKTGSAMTKRENMHKMAEANKAFAHFARF